MKAFRQFIAEEESDHVKAFHAAMAEAGSSGPNKKGHHHFDDTAVNLNKVHHALKKAGYDKSFAGDHYDKPVGKGFSLVKRKTRGDKLVVSHENIGISK